MKIMDQSQEVLAVLEEIKKIAKNSKITNKENFIKDFISKSFNKSHNYPTWPLMQNAIIYISEKLKDNSEKEIKELKKVINSSIQKFSKLLQANQDKIIKKGDEIIGTHENVFLHSYCPVIEGILGQAKAVGKKFKVYNTETRPLFQGHLTAESLLQKNHKVTMVADAAAAFLISEHSGKQLMMDKIILGAEMIDWDGSVINKTGSYGIAVSAYQTGVPVYIAASLLKTDNDRIIKIEERPGKELWGQAPTDLKMINFAFDKIPAEFITGIICEFGIIHPSEVEELVRNNYDWLLK